MTDDEKVLAEIIEEAIRGTSQSSHIFKEAAKAILAAGYSRRGDESPCHLSNLSPTDARAIAAALLAAAILGPTEVTTAS